MVAERQHVGDSTFEGSGYQCGPNSLFRTWERITALPSTFSTMTKSTSKQTTTTTRATSKVTRANAKATKSISEPQAPPPSAPVPVSRDPPAPPHGAGPATGKRRERPKSKPTVEKEESEELENSGESEESEEDEAVGVAKKKELTKIEVPSIRSRATDRLASARISINRMNLLHPPIPLRFGQWNDRSLVERYAKVLQNSFQTQGVRSLEMENMIPLVIRKDHLDSKCLDFRGLNAAEAPFLLLSSEGLKASSIKVAGGRHRCRAVELEAERLSTEIKRLEGKIEDDDTATEEEKDMNRAYRTTIETLTKEKERVCTWGVVIYDEGKGSIAISRVKKSEIELIRVTLGGGRDARNRAIAEREEAPIRGK